jgi:hypothetical protein
VLCGNLIPWNPSVNLPRCLRLVLCVFSVFPLLCRCVALLLLLLAVPLLLELCVRRWEWVLRCRCAAAAAAIAARFL